MENHHQSVDHLKDQISGKRSFTDIDNSVYNFGSQLVLEQNNVYVEV